MVLNEFQKKASEIITEANIDKTLHIIVYKPHSGASTLLRYYASLDTSTKLNPRSVPPCYWGGLLLFDSESREEDINYWAHRCIHNMNSGMVVFTQDFKLKENFKTHTI